MVGPPGFEPGTKDKEGLVAITLNLNGHLCAGVVCAAALEDLGNAAVIEAVCVKYEGESGRATSMIDMKTGPVPARGLISAVALG